MLPRHRVLYDDSATTDQRRAERDEMRCGRASDTRRFGYTSRVYIHDSSTELMCGVLSLYSVRPGAAANYTIFLFTRHTDTGRTATPASAIATSTTQDPRRPRTPHPAAARRAPHGARRAAGRTAQPRPLLVPRKVEITRDRLRYRPSPRSLYRVLRQITGV